MNKQRGSALLATMVMVVVLAGMCAALQMSTISSYRAARQSLDLREADWAADAALSYYTLQLEIDLDFFVNNPAPHAPVMLGGAQFQLSSATPGADDNEWIVDVTAGSELIDYRVLAVLADAAMAIPNGLVLTGTGNPSDDVLVMNGASQFGCYDPAVGIGALNDNATVWANGSISQMGTSLIVGDATASGWISSVGPSGITGTETEVATEFENDPFEILAMQIASNSLASNDNANLPAIFGASWTPIGGPGNFGNLNVSGGNYVLTAGTYRFSDLSIANGANLVLDTSSGPITIVSANGVDIDSGSVVTIDSGATQNGVMTVLEDGAGFVVQGGASYGSEVNEPLVSGYSQLMAIGENGDIEVQGSSTLMARLAAPGRHLLVGGDSEFYGSAVAKSANLIGSGPKFYVDESVLGTTFGSTGDYDVIARWRGTIAP